MKSLLPNNKSILSIIALLIYSGSVFAAGIEEVIVTAQKREQSAQDIGLTISSFNEESLRELQANDVGSISEQISGVQYYSSANLPSFTIRGVGMSEFSGNFDAPVGIHIDEVYLSKPFMASMGLFDMARVDAVKGPQGTLFGRNTTGGAVNFYTVQPSEEFGAGVNLTYGNYNRLHNQGYVTGSISENLLGRFSFSSEIAGDGPYTNTFNGDDLAKADKQQFRAQLDWASDRLSVDATVSGGYDKSELTPYKNTLAGSVDPDDTFTVNQDHAPDADNEAFGVSLDIEYEFDSFTFTSISAFNHFIRDQREDSDATPTDTVNLLWYTEIDQFTQELRLTGDYNDSRGRYVAGFFYEHDDLEERDSTSLVTGNVALPARVGNDFGQELDSLAVFFDTEYDAVERVTVKGGIRYSKDMTESAGSTFVGTGNERGGTPLTVLVPVASLDSDRTDTDISGKLGVDFTLSDDALLYTNLSTGYRAGGFAYAFGGAITQFEPEKVTNIEVGFKGQFFENTLQVNAAAYRTIIDDVQVNIDVVGSVVPVTQNAGKSKTGGLETDLWWKPKDEWDIKAGFAYMDSEIVSSTATSAGVPLAGKRPINTPEFSSNGSVRYERPIANNLRLILMSNFNWTDKRFLELTNAATSIQDSYYILNARAAIASDDGRWEVAAWGKNITDTEYLTYVNDVSPLFVLEINGEPATYGLSLNYNF